MEMICWTKLRSILILSLLPASYASTSESVWVREQTFDDMLSSTGYRILAYSRTDCSRKCSQSATCVSFFFAPNQEFNCRLHDTIMTSPIGLTSEPSSKYYILDGASLTTPIQHYIPSTPTISVSTPAPSQFACHAADNNFRTVLLTDGNSFTYKAVKTLSTQGDAIIACEDQGGFLVRVTTLAKMEMLLQLTACSGFSGDGYFVDGSNAAATDFFAVDAWVMQNGDQVPMSKDFWGSNYPNRPDAQHCLRMRADVSYKWDDCQCDDPYYFICEK